MVKKGIDPAIEESRQRRATIEADETAASITFEGAFEEYLRRKASKLKSGRHIEREIRREFKTWMASAAGGYHTVHGEGKQFRGIIERDAETQAHFAFGILRTFFNWAVDSGDFDIEVSPCAKLKPTVLIGPRNVRSRVLKDFEIAAYWRASEAMGYPFGKFFQLLALTALRRNEAADGRWSEIDFASKLWVIPEERMKGGARPCRAAGAGDPGASRKPSTIRRRRLPLLNDRRQSPGERLLARQRLGWTSSCEWTLKLKGCHSSRLLFMIYAGHAGRSFLRLPVEDIVRELLLAHARPGLHKVYDLHLMRKKKQMRLSFGMRN